MVTIKEALALSAAGFTADEIRQMAAGTDPAPAEPEPEQEPEPAEPEPAKEDQPADSAYLTADEARKLVESLLKQSRQRENAQNAQRGSVDRPKTAQDVIRDLAKGL